jgi:hypothetical protein
MAQYHLFQNGYGNCLFKIKEEHKNAICDFIKSFGQNDRRPESSKKGVHHNSEGSVLILVGCKESDTQLLRHFIMNQLKQELNLDIQRVTGCI